MQLCVILCVCECWSVFLWVSAASWEAVVGIGPETAGVMTFSQQATEQRVIFFHGWWAYRFRKAWTGIPIQINILKRGILASTLKMRWTDNRVYQCYKSAKCLRLQLIVMHRKCLIFLCKISLTLPGESWLKRVSFILQFTHAQNKQSNFQWYFEDNVLQKWFQMFHTADGNPTRKSSYYWF